METQISTTGKHKRHEHNAYEAFDNPNRERSELLETVSDILHYTNKTLKCNDSTNKLSYKGIHGLICLEWNIKNINKRLTPSKNE